MSDKIIDINGIEINKGDTVFVISDYIKNNYDIDYLKFGADWAGSKDVNYPDPELAKDIDEMSEEEYYDFIKSEQALESEEDYEEAYSPEEEDYRELDTRELSVPEMEEEEKKLDVRKRNEDENRSTLDAKRNKVSLGDKVKITENPDMMGIVKDIDFIYQSKMDTTVKLNEITKLQKSIQELSSAMSENLESIIIANKHTNGNKWLLQNKDFDTYLKFLKLFTEKYKYINQDKRKKLRRFLTESIMPEILISTESGDIIKSPLDIIKISNNIKNNRKKLAAVISNSIECWFLVKESKLLKSMVGDSVDQFETSKQAAAPTSQLPVLDVSKLDFTNLENIEIPRDFDKFIIKEYPLEDDVATIEEEEEGEDPKVDLYLKLYNSLDEKDLPDLDEINTESSISANLKKIYDVLNTYVTSEYDKLHAAYTNDARGKFEDSYDEYDKNIMTLYKNISKRLPELKRKHMNQGEDDIIAKLIKGYSSKFPSAGFDKVDVYDVKNYLQKEKEDIAIPDEFEILTKAIERAKVLMGEKYAEINIMDKLFNAYSEDKETGEKVPKFKDEDFIKYYGKHKNTNKLENLKNTIKSLNLDIDVGEFLNFVNSNIKESGIVKLLIKEAEEGKRYVVPTDDPTNPQVMAEPGNGNILGDVMDDVKELVDPQTDETAYVDKSEFESDPDIKEVTLPDEIGKSAITKEQSDQLNKLGYISNKENGND